MDYEYEYEDEAPQGRVLWGRIGLLAVALLLVFVVGRCTAGDGDSDEELQALSQEVDDLREQRDALQAELDAIEAGGVESEPEPEAEAEPEEADEAEDASDGDADEETSDAADGESTRTHEVQANDTLYTIAEQYYGDGSMFTLITEANNLSRDDPLRVGQVLDIPPSD